MKKRGFLRFIYLISCIFLFDCNFKDVGDEDQDITTNKTEQTLFNKNNPKKSSKQTSLDDPDLESKSNEINENKENLEKNKKPDDSLESNEIIKNENDEEIANKVNSEDLKFDYNSMEFKQKIENIDNNTKNFRKNDIKNWSSELEELLPRMYMNEESYLSKEISEKGYRLFRKIFKYTYDLNDLSENFVKKIIDYIDNNDKYWIKLSDGDLSKFESPAFKNPLSYLRVFQHKSVDKFKIFDKFSSNVKKIILDRRKFILSCFLNIKHDELINYLNNKIEVNETLRIALRLSIVGNNIKAIDALLAKYPNLFTKEEYNGSNTDIFPLIVSAKFSNAETFSHLLKIMDIDIEEIDRSSSMPWLILKEVLEIGDEEKLKIILKKLQDKSVGIEELMSNSMSYQLLKASINDGGRYYRDELIRSHGVFYGFPIFIKEIFSKIMNQELRNKIINEQWGGRRPNSLLIAAQKQNRQDILDIISFLN